MRTILYSSLTFDYAIFLAIIGIIHKIFNCLLSIREDLDVPVKYIGVGEKIDDLQPFVPKEFAKALFEVEKDD